MLRICFRFILRATHQLVLTITYLVAIPQGANPRHPGKSSSLATQRRTLKVNSHFLSNSRQYTPVFLRTTSRPTIPNSRWPNKSHLPRLAPAAKGGETSPYKIRTKQVTGLYLNSNSNCNILSKLQRLVSRITLHHINQVNSNNSNIVPHRQVRRQALLWRNKVKSYPRLPKERNSLSKKCAKSATLVLNIHWLQLKQSRIADSFWPSQKWQRSKSLKRCTTWLLMNLKSIPQKPKG